MVLYHVRKKAQVLLFRPPVSSWDILCPVANWGCWWLFGGVLGLGLYGDGFNLSVGMYHRESLKLPASEGISVSSWVYEPAGAVHLPLLGWYLLSQRVKPKTRNPKGHDPHLGRRFVAQTHRNNSTVFAPVRQSRLGVC